MKVKQKKDEIYNFEITNVYDLGFILKLIIVYIKGSPKSVLFVNT